MCLQAIFSLSCLWLRSEQERVRAALGSVRTTVRTASSRCARLLCGDVLSLGCVGKEVCEKRAARDKNKYHTVRGGYLTQFYPKSVPLPEPESLPATDAILNGTCKSTYPRPRALAAIKNHKDWYAHQELVKARDVHVKNNPSLGRTAPSTTAKPRASSPPQRLSPARPSMSVSTVRTPPPSPPTPSRTSSSESSAFGSPRRFPPFGSRSSGACQSISSATTFTTRPTPAAPQRRPRRLGGRYTRPGQRAGRAR